MRLMSLGALGITLMLAGSVSAAPGSETNLIAAIKQGDVARARTLLQQRADANVKDPDGTTALHWAVQRDQVEIIDALLSGGADAKVLNRYGLSPLLVACELGNVQVIDKLLRAGANPNSATPGGETALMIAARTGKVAAVKRLMAAGADINAKEQLRGQTALMWAAAEDNVDATTALLEGGADINARSPGGFTALLFAVRAGHAGVAKALVAHGADANDPLQPAARSAAPMRGGGAPQGQQPQRPAGANRNVVSPVNAAPPANAGPAAATGSAASAASIPQLLQVFNTGSRGRGGAGGTSPLVMAVTNAHYAMAGMLLDLGADPNANGQGWTALHQLAWTRRPPIQHGLPPAVPTGDVTSLELAEKLLQYGADPNIRQTREPSDGARNILNRLGSTPFLLAAKSADIPFMKLLLDYGADPSITTDEGATALMAAAGVGIWQVGENPGTNEEALEAVKICIERGNDVNAVDVNNDTALHGAAHRGANEIVTLLIQKGANPNVVNVLGWTALVIAKGVLYPNTFNRRLDTAELLLKLGADPKVGKPRPQDVSPSEEPGLAVQGR